MPPAPAKKSNPGNVVAQARGRKGGAPPRAAGPAGGSPGGPTGPAGPARGSRAGRAWEQFKSIAGAVAIFLFVRAFLVEAFRIPSGSMVPTLLVGDWLFVNKLRYGPHVPFTRVNLPGYAEPRRGDVVVFESPYQADEAEVGNDPTPTLVKRLVGVPGDTVFMRRGVLHVNGIAQRQGYAAAADPVIVENQGSRTDPHFEWMRRAAVRGTRFDRAFGAPPAVPTLDAWGPLVVPPERLFMLGDARYESKDGRYWGLVPRANVRGRPLFVYYSFDPEQGLPFFRAFSEIRWGRIGHRIR